MTALKATLNVDELMVESGVKFGTSGARGLVSAMTDRVCFGYAMGFLRYLKESQGLTVGTPILIAGDRRPSTPRIMRALALASQHLGHPVLNCGLIPSPAVALLGMKKAAPAIMVTGSHIPDDRNGIKFNTAAGEVTKEDEEGMRKSLLEFPAYFSASGQLEGVFEKRAEEALGAETSEALDVYRARYLDAFPADCLSGLRVGVYGHSAVGRDFLVELYSSLGAEVVSLGFSETFIPVDTEAIRDEDVRLAADWAAEHKLDSIVSTDGDSDRPLTSDEQGQWVRGDVSGILTSSFLGASAVATPVSCNTALEKSGQFSTVVRTRIGSPFVIAGMQKALASGEKAVVGYEANGGFLMLTPHSVPNGQELPALPTRDAVIVHLALLLLAKASGTRISEVLEKLPRRVTASGRDQGFAQQRSLSLLERLRSASDAELLELLSLGKVKGRDETDGLRLTFESEEVLHFRPSGNAPELRCYAESNDRVRSEAMVSEGLAVARVLSPF